MIAILRLDYLSFHSKFLQEGTHGPASVRSQLGSVTNGKQGYLVRTREL